MPLVLNGPLIRKMRERLGYSQARLAELANISVRSVARIESGESGKNHPGTGEALASALRMRVEQLLMEEAPPTPPPDLSTMRTVLLEAPRVIPARAAPPPGDPLGTRNNPAPLPKSPVLHFSTAFRAEQGRYFGFTGWVRKLTGVNDLERIALGSAKRGVSALFDVGVRAGPASSTIAVYAADVDVTRALADAIAGRHVLWFVTQLVAVETSADHKTLNDDTDLETQNFRRDWRGFRWADRKTLTWWALQVVHAQAM